MICSCRIGILRLFIQNGTNVPIAAFRTQTHIFRLGQGTLRHDGLSVTTPWRRGLRTSSPWEDVLLRETETEEGLVQAPALRDGNWETKPITDTEPLELSDSDQSSPLTETNITTPAPKTAGLSGCDQDGSTTDDSKEAAGFSETHHPSHSDVVVQTGRDTRRFAQFSKGDKPLPPNLSIETDTTGKPNTEHAGLPLPSESALETSNSARSRPRETLREKRRRLKEARRPEAAKVGAEEPSNPRAKKQALRKRQDHKESSQTKDAPHEANYSPKSEESDLADPLPEKPRVKRRWRRRAEGEGPRTKAELLAMRREGQDETVMEQKVPRKAPQPKVRYPSWWPQWRIQKEALKAKFPEGWKPLRKLSPDACEGIRALHQQLPDEYTTPVLANKFKVSPEAIRRILKSKRKPTEEQKDDQAKSWHERGKKIWARYAELGVKPPRVWRQEGVTRPAEFHEKRRRRVEWREREASAKMSKRAEKLAQEPGFEEFHEKRRGRAKRSQRTKKLASEPGLEESHEKRRRSAEWREREASAPRVERTEKLVSEPSFEEEMRRA